MGQERPSSTAFVLRSRFVTSALLSKLPSLFGFVPGTFLSVQVYRWTGENSYFVKGNTDSLQMGGGGYVCTVCFKFQGFFG